MLSLEFTRAHPLGPDPLGYLRLQLSQSTTTGVYVAHVHIFERRIDNMKTKLKGRFHGLKDRARRLSHELGATVAVSPMPEGAGGGRRAADTVGEGGEGAGREGGDHTHNTLLSILRRRNLGESKDPKGQSVERGPRRRPTSTGCATS